LVAKIIEYEGESTQSTLAESTLLPLRTVRYALDQLEEAALISSRISFADAQKRVYALELES
jgi:DNA-binding MarR family transcriptional regulator